jgi:hypothetical protein
MADDDHTEKKEEASEVSGSLIDSVQLPSI